ncbi:hypothetical protein [Mesorhizobium sp. NPDC059025]|uniref:hypothetical protein n=1 Tax=unclassified Mesorhizobium TaxID=325217 RepID=UPI0036CFA03C
MPQVDKQRREEAERLRKATLERSEDEAKKACCCCHCSAGQATPKAGGLRLKEFERRNWEDGAFLLPRSLVLDKPVASR